MSIEFYSQDKDDVIGGFVISGSTTYEYALEALIPLIGRLDIQRDALKTRFYSRLEDDIVRGCMMPPITIAFIHTFTAKNPGKSNISNFITKNIKNAFVLDGIQRLNTLKKASTKNGFNKAKRIQINFIITNSRDRLLYRMITLNNGQKPMSARHQIDILADSFFDFNGIELNLVAEKGNGRVRAPDTFKKADFVKGYVAYLSESVNIDNQKIIEEKMDELIASKIIDSDIPTSEIEFSDLVQLVNKFSESDSLREWIRVQNNFIGFCVGAKTSAKTLSNTSIEAVEKSIQEFEKAFLSINVSKVNLGKVRRESVAQFIEGFGKYRKLGEYELLDKISGWI
jgi:hypothetical protein